MCGADFQLLLPICADNTDYSSLVFLASCICLTMDFVLSLLPKQKYLIMKTRSLNSKLSAALKL